MKKTGLQIICVLLVIFCTACNRHETIKVLQFNIWQEGTVVANGFDALADEIVRSDADFITLSEVRNYRGTRFCDRLVAALKQRGQTYYSFYSDDSGLLSRYPIADSMTVYPLRDDRGSIYKLIAKKGNIEVALYTAHLDYRNCAYYDAKGYDGSTWQTRKPVTDVDSLLALNRRSVRDDAAACFLAEAEKDRKAGRAVILGGDFNEPSYLDWTEATRNMRDHNGLAVSWDVSVMLAEAGFRDSYREMYPDPLTHPGFTYPADCRDTDLEKLLWATDADERDRIDFIMYAPERLSLVDVSIIGPKGDICRGKRVLEPTSDPIHEPMGVWPTDHKAVLAVFNIY